jgi:UDPglucose 6-dehydrogenase
MYIGIVGGGFVGNAIYQNFKDKVNTKLYDIDPKKSFDTLYSTLKCNIIFVCLPTPMKEDGECDTSYIMKFFEGLEWNSGLFVIKSTVPIGTTDKLVAMRPDLKIVHNPEFLTAVNAVQDFRNSDRTIIGGRQDLCIELSDFFLKHAPYTTVQIVKSKESETIKYFCNSFLAAKVSFFNNLYELCQKFNMNYDSVKDGVCSDSRIGDSHSRVPGIDGLLGFGGYCFPKDINALINTLNENDVDSSLFQAAWDYNKRIRSE